MSDAIRTKVVGTTRLVKQLGEGGMARVHLGVQLPLQRQVAIKVMHPNVARSTDLRTRFRLEALALAGLQHENIVAIYDFVEKNRQFFMILEYVDGVDLATLLREGPLPVDVALLVGSGVARALEHAHFRKVLHRDIKPANVMVSRAGQVKLMDFGLAKDLNLGDRTRTGVVLGTPSYFPPEILRGARPDNRSDLYTLGVLLYQTISGQRPFKGKDDAELFTAILKGDRKRLREVAPGVPRGVEKIVDRCLESDPEKRWQRAAEIRWRIDRHLGVMLATSPQARLLTFLGERGEVDAEDLSNYALDDRTVYQPPTEAGDSRPAKKGRAAVDVASTPSVSRASSRLAKVALTLFLLAALAVGARTLAPAATTRAALRTWNAVKHLAGQD